jgi:hypothetical protein
MHCDVVVGVDGGRAHLVGGNVQQGVTMRLLNINRVGRFWALPQRFGGESTCSPNNAAACDFNRQDWSVLLKLRPPGELARLPHLLPPMAAPLPIPMAPSCCVNCVLGAAVPRCPDQGATSER